MFQNTEARRRFIDEIIQLRKEQYRIEYDLQCVHQMAQSRLLERLADEHRDTQLTKLVKIYESEVRELKRNLEMLNLEEMKSLAKKHADRNELNRYVSVFVFTSSDMMCILFYAPN